MGSTQYEERIQDFTAGKHEQLSSRKEVKLKKEVKVCQMIWLEEGEI